MSTPDAFTSSGAPLHASLGNGTELAVHLTAAGASGPGIKPGPTNTGIPPGVTLTTYTGPSTVTAAGTVIDSKDIAGGIRIAAQDVVILNCLIHDNMLATAGVYVEDTASLLIIDTEIHTFQVGMVYANWTGIRLNIHDITFDGIKMGSNTELRESWIHHPVPQEDAHWDGIQVQAGITNTVIRGNNIDPSGVDANSALFLSPDLGPTSAGPLVVTGNWLNGGNYTVYCLPGYNGDIITDITFTNNRFGDDFKFGHSYVGMTLTQSGNVIDSTGAPYLL